MKDISVLVYGGGAVGSIFGWRLSQHSRVKVSVVCRSNYDTVRRSGFEFQTVAWGNGRFIPHQVLSTGQLHQSRQAYDYVICANKVTKESCASISRDLGAVIDSQTTLVSAQNGMNVEVPLRQAFPHNTILSAICNIGCSQPRHGSVHQAAGMNPKAFLIGVYGHASHKDLTRRDSLVCLDHKFGHVDNVAQHRWRKLLFNSVWNATCALSNLDTREACQQPDVLRLACELAREACLVAELSGSGVEQSYSDTVVKLAQESGPITPSTLQDVRAGRSLEIHSIWGFLKEQASELGTYTPMIRLVHDTFQKFNRDLCHQQSLDDIRDFTTQPQADCANHVQAVQHWLRERLGHDEELLHSSKTAIAV